jgi:uncharacterized protein YhbP (UPF0306 family)
MRGIITILLILFFSGCATTYKVVDKKEVTIYMIEDIKTKEVKMIISKRRLHIGGLIKIRELPYIELINGEYIEPTIWKVKKKKR